MNYGVAEPAFVRFLPPHHRFRFLPRQPFIKTFIFNCAIVRGPVYLKLIFLLAFPIPFQLCARFSFRRATLAGFGRLWRTLHATIAIRMKYLFVSAFQRNAKDPSTESFLLPFVFILFPLLSIFTFSLSFPLSPRPAAAGLARRFY